MLIASSVDSCCSAYLELLRDHVDHGLVELDCGQRLERGVVLAHQVGRDVQRLLVGEAQVGHVGVVPVAPRVLEPREEPLGGHL